MNPLFDFKSSDQAARLQRDLSGKVSQNDDDSLMVRFVCGLDAAYRGETAYVAAAVWDAVRREFVDKTHSVRKVPVGYISGFLGFREGPLLVEIARSILPHADVFLVDGHGVAHPRRFGLGCHVGLGIDRPTIGVAKSLLYGRGRDGSIVAPDGEVIGQIVTSENDRKFYVSVGHRVSLVTACKIVEGCMLDGHPGPLRRAHLDSIRLKEGRPV